MSAECTIDNSLIFLATQKSASAMGIEFQVDGKLERDAALSREFEWISNDPAIAKTVVGVLFPEGVPPDLDFYARMERLRRALGFTTWSEHIVTLLWITALKSLTEEDRQKLLLRSAF